MHNYRPERIYIENAVENSPITRNVLASLPDVPTNVIESSDPLLEESKRWNPTIARAKRSLLLAEHRGRFFKSCPAGSAPGGTANVCCNYFVINYAGNCHMECSYCYLQAYLNFPYLVVHANVGDLLVELDSVLSSNPNNFFRIGTGELADSLALDALTRYSAPLVEFFKHRKNAVLEFKTKSNCVVNLLSLDHGGRTVVSWSMNPRFIQEQEEHKTATIDERFEAAAQCVAAGYPVAFHLDPLIHYPNWEADYHSLVQEIFERIPSQSIAWISVGALRMTPTLKQIMRERFPASFLPLGELVPTEDGKLRYFKPIRVEMYQKMVGWIRAISSKTPLYTCMEGSSVWTKVFDGPSTVFSTQIEHRFSQINL